MNYDMKLLNRALFRAGQEALTNDDKEKNTTKYRTITAFYMPTLLLLLSEADWTGLMKRETLTEEAEVNLTEYGYAYPLPRDLARAIEIDSNADYRIEGNILYCNVMEPTLLYIPNGKRNVVTELPTEDEGQVVYEGESWTWDSDAEAYARDEEQDDEVLYDEVELPEELREAFEYHLAAQITLKITGDANLYNLLMQYAMAMEERSRKTTRGRNKSAQKGHTWWSERLGFTDSETEDDDYVTY